MDIDTQIAEILARGTASNDNFKTLNDLTPKGTMSGVINVVGNHNIVINFGLWFLPALFLAFYALIICLFY